MVVIHSNQRLDSTYESVIKYSEPQNKQRVYTIAHLVKTLVDVQSTIFQLKTVKVWQDVFSAWPYKKPIADYWIWSAPETKITSKDAYTIFELMADLGGFIFFIALIGRLLLDSCLRGTLSSFMAARLYTWTLDP